MADHEEASAKIEIAHVLTIELIDRLRASSGDPDDPLTELNEAVYQSTRFHVADTAGKLIRGPRDNGLALIFFGEPFEALECAEEIARALKSRPNATARMGLHSGPVHRATGPNGELSVAGPGLDTARRVMECGGLRHILLSKRIAYEVAPMARWSPHLYELGEATVQHGERIGLVNFYTDEIGNPGLPEKLKRERAAEARHAMRKSLGRRLAIIAMLMAFLIVIGLLYFYAQKRTQIEPAATVAPPEKSIAIMPLVDRSPLHDQEYLCDGISEEVLVDLAGTGPLRVVARDSSFALKGKSADPLEIGRKLNVTAEFEGNLRREGTRVRVTADVVNVRDGSRLWSDTIETEAANISSIPDTISAEVAGALKVTVTGVRRVVRSKNAEAYDLYLHGLELSHRGDADNLRSSLEFFQRAVDLEPSLGRAWTGIASDWFRRAELGMAPKEAFPSMAAAAGKALALNERDADAHAYLGEQRRVVDYDIKTAENEFNRALELNPSLPLAHCFMATTQAIFRNGARSLEEMQKAIRFDPLSARVASMQVSNLVLLNRLDDAYAAAKRTVEIDPEYIYFEPALALVYRAQGKFGQALEIYERMAQAQHHATAGLAISYARLDKKEDAQRVLDDLILRANTDYFPADHIAAVEVALGKNEEALHWLNRAADEHSITVHQIAIDPDFRALRSDRRFADVLERIGLDPKVVLPPRNAGVVR